MITKTMAWLMVSVLVLALQLGYIHAKSTRPLRQAQGAAPALSWRVVAVTDLGQQLDSRSTADRFVLIEIEVTNSSNATADYPGFNLLTPDKMTIFPHLGNLALEGMCTPRPLEPGETLACGHVFELRETVEAGVVVVEGNGEAAVSVP